MNRLICRIFGHKWTEWCRVHLPKAWVCSRCGAVKYDPDADPAAVRLLRLYDEAP